MPSKHKVIAVEHQPKGLADSFTHNKSPSSVYKTHNSRLSTRSLIQEVDKTDKMTRRKALTLVHRIAIYGAAVFFLKVCLSACIDIIHELVSTQSPMISITPVESLLLGKWVGTTTIRASPLVTQLLGNDTTPRNGTLYLDTNATSFSGCSNMTADIYLNDFQRRTFSSFVRDTAYALAFFSSLTSELVVPVVDCTIEGADNSLMRYFYLMRSLSDSNDVYLVIASMGMQDMNKIAGQIGQSPAAVTTIAAISNFTARVEHHFAIAEGYPYKSASFEVYKYLSTTSENQWRLQRSPSMASAVATVITTSFRLGFYRREEKSQGNIKNLIWELPSDPLDLVKYWRLTGRPVLTNTWAWIHAIFFQLALDMFLKLYLIIVLTILYVKKRKIWIHDGFSAIATKLSVLTPLILLSWAIEGGWSVLELAIYDGNVITGMQTVTFRDSIIRADLLVLCYSITAVIGNLTKTRIDPLAATLAFCVAFERRRVIIQWFPSLTTYITSYTTTDYALGKDSTENVALISPLAHWGTHKITTYPIGLVCASIGAIVGSYVVIILIFMVLHKAYRWYFPEQIQVIRITNRSLHDEDLLQQRRTQTIFEIATGAQLLDRYGLISDYQNYIYVRGVKFATTDGIYASGFAIANDKYVVQAHDLRMIWLMRATGVRLKDIYAYPLTGKIVERTAHLVYPDTFSAEDLAKISVSKLQ